MVASCAPSFPSLISKLMLPSSPHRYNLSFTAASLRPELARIIAECYLELSDWGATKDRILTSNALQARSRASGIRMERELRQRIQTLTPEQLGLLADSTIEDRAAMSWLAMIKYNKLPLDFAAETLREKLAEHDPVLRPSDYEAFVEAKASAYPELSNAADTTKAKVQRVLLRMLTEAGLLGGGPAFGTVQRPVLSPAVTAAIRADDPRWLAGFLVPETEMAAR